MESGAKGCEVVVSGKLRGQRAKSMKFVDGLMIHSGEPTNVYVDTAVRHVLLRQGIVLFFSHVVLQVLIFLYFRCARHQGQDHVALGSQQQKWTQTTPSR
jgi:Ribosomal protein S3, C-terminal domain